jgi:hypothetical protein
MNDLWIRILANYKTEGPFVQQRVKTVFLLMVMMMTAFFVFGFIRLISGSWATALGEFVIVLAMAAGAWALVKGRFRIASLVVQFITVGAVVLIVILRPGVGGEPLFVTGTYLFAALILLPLLAYRRTQIVLSIIISILTITWIWLSRTNGLSGTNTVDWVLLVGLLFFAGIFLIQSFNVQVGTLEFVNREAALEKKRYSTLTALLDSVSGSFTVGKVLNESAAKTKNHALSVNQAVETP